ncbi:MAG: FAD-binding oxidoreductase [Sphingomonadales bacterium]|nr:FAD-binding oxidoreductase [Sphingomonadales bacterium]
MDWRRREVLRGAGAAGLALGLGACGDARPAVGLPPAGARPSLVPMRLTLDQLIDVKCCIRPLRAAGPNLSAERLGDTLVIHNYGHGGSGWSLSWGSAEIAVGKAMSTLPREVAVIGCGIIGLTTAVVAQRAGLRVTIYARELIQRTRSFRASGSFTPDSRVALAEPAGPAFGDLWEKMARLSWKAFRTYLGQPGNPVEFGDSYAVSESPITRRHWPRDPAITGSWKPGGLPQQNSEFGHYNDRIKDIMRQPVDLAPEENPFALPYAQRSSQMYFNFASYGHALLSEFFAMGGHFINREFHEPAELAGLPEKVVIHCTGYAARDFWRDDTIIPVRGQTGWLVPQDDAHYAVRHHNLSVHSKRDGIVVMNNLDPSGQDIGEMLGVGDSMELPDRGPIEAALKTLQPLFGRGGRS